MSTTDRKVHSAAFFARDPIGLGVGSVPISQAAVIFALIVPYQGFVTPFPYAMKGWQVENVQVFCTAIVATAQVDVQGGVHGSTTSVLTGLITPVAGAATQGVLVAPASRRFNLSDELNIKCTTNGTGTLTNLIVTVTVRPFPMDNEAF